MQVPPVGRGQRFQVMYRKYQRVIYSRCRKLLNDDASAEDAAQEVFLRVFKHFDEAPPEDQLLAWMSRISTNYCLNQIRNGKARSRHMNHLGHGCTVDEFEPAVEARQLVKRVVSQAPADHREPAVMYHLKEMDQQTIAELLGVTRRTVINRLNAFAERARQFLMQASLGKAE